MRMNKGLVPKLRFAEFSNSYWGITQLNILAYKITERNKDDDISRVFTNSAIEGVVSQEEYFDRNIANKNNLTNYFIVKKGDYIYNPRISNAAPVGPISKNKLGIGVMSPLYTVFRFRNKENDFYEHFFLTNLWHAYVKSHSNTGARHDRITISVDNFMKMPLPYTSLEEQQKIADCLSSIDELIDAESRKLKALEKYKKGLMQKLFPAEGKTLPEWRFPEFQGCGEWKSKAIEHACQMFSGGTPDTSKKEFYGGEIPFIRSAEINKSSTELFITEEGFKNSSAKMVKKGDVLIALYGANSGEVALSKINGAINQAILCLRHETNNEFVYHYFTHMKNWIISKYIQGGQGNLSGQIIKSVNFYFPKPEEQQKIADCLSELDTLITEQINKIDQLKTHKKGLMQGLFPSLEEADV
ncbi:MAG: restriction endonuclease subunit S [Oscillospiraceae bacterium]|jgi:type I restriction enzyme S subunit|nr:restriction endonuclease subunit S [Oscillospiraceae bacterium]